MRSVPRRLAEEIGCSAENPCVRAVPSRRVHLQIYAVDVPRAGTARSVSTRRLRWGHMKVNFASYVCGSNTSVMPGWHPCLSELLVEARRDALSTLCSDQALVVPVPLHWWRYWRRGYNQAEALAEGIAKQLKLPIRRFLKRVVGTRQLADLSRTARGEVVRNVFRARARSRMTGRTVLLVDDVLTTGATCGAAARALKKAGAARVVVAVIARTEQTTV